MRPYSRNADKTVAVTLPLTDEAAEAFQAHRDQQLIKGFPAGPDDPVVIDPGPAPVVVAVPAAALHTAHIPCALSPRCPSCACVNCKVASQTAVNRRPKARPAQPPASTPVAKDRALPFQSMLSAYGQQGRDSRRREREEAGCATAVAKPPTRRTRTPSPTPPRRRPARSPPRPCRCPRRSWGCRCPRRCRT